ncbi:unnamed protein product [Rodentolepis nana]|uniref:Centrosomal protein of 162 kDa n=1 Tax=Rodentolepis nana TaxID=102285 RepID=A0A0R3T9A7_RODNA|nr:unnamed protein product [Rodentolepis nana]
MELNDIVSEVITKCNIVEQQTILNEEKSHSCNESLCSENLDIKSFDEKDNELQLNGHRFSALLCDDFKNQNEVFTKSVDSNSLVDVSDENYEFLKSNNLITQRANNVAQNDCNTSESVATQSTHSSHADESDDPSVRQSNAFDQNNSLSEYPTRQQNGETDQIRIVENLKEITDPNKLCPEISEEYESSLLENKGERTQTSSASNKSNEHSPKISLVDSPSFSNFSKFDESCGNVNINDEKNSAILQSIQSGEDSEDSKPDIPESPDTDSASNKSSVVDLEPLSEIDFLRNKVSDLTEKLLRSQEQMETLLEEKQKWLSTRPLPQQKVPPSNQKNNVSSDMAAFVVKFAQSEQQRMKAENRIQELEAMISRTMPIELNSSFSADKSGPMTELNKALSEARERAENLRHSLKQEQARVSDLNSKLTATREAHRSEQKRAAGQVEVINKLSRDVDQLKRQLKDMEKIREREAKRLCDEMTLQETTEKYKKALTEITNLKDRISELEKVQESKAELETEYEELKRAHDNLVSVRDEMTRCVERETQLSEFTRRLTERTAGLQSAHLAAQERLAASEKAVSEASRAANEATELLQATEARARNERAEAAATIEQLEAKISKLTESEAFLKSELTREKVEKAALKRKQHGLDRELARLMTQQRKLSIQELRQQSSQKLDNMSEKTSMGSNLSLSVVPDEKIPPFPDSCHTPEAVQNSTQAPPLGDALVSSTENTRLASLPDETSSIFSPEVQTREPNRNLLLNKIDRLQKTNMRLMDKIDFMHEHIGQLTHELQKKTKILQNCLSREAENEGAAVPTAVDANKRQRIRRGGTLMAAVFSGDASAPASDLRTSLQLNNKLQSVLEDTLYKNLTLKENVDTLADEIARLKRANSELKDLVSSQHLEEATPQKRCLVHSTPSKSN